VSERPAPFPARVLFALAGVGAASFLAGIAFDLPAVRLISKSVPVACLAVWVAGTPTRYARYVAAGLSLSALGDFLLETSDSFFLHGLLAFLGAHVAYVLAFLRASRRPALLRALPFVAWGLATFSVLRSDLGELRLAVAGYMAAIVTMMWRAAARPGRTALLGAMLFGASDTLIAFDRFHAPLPWARYPIILVYWAGQLLIALSQGDEKRPDAASRTRVMHTRRFSSPS
jgi:alkenylglycerophosphocholine hydrolase